MILIDLSVLKMAKGYNGRSKHNSLSAGIRAAYAERNGMEFIL